MILQELVQGLIVCCHNPVSGQMYVRIIKKERQQSASWTFRLQPSIRYTIMPYGTQLHSEVRSNNHGWETTKDKEERRNLLRTYCDNNSNLGINSQRKCLLLDLDCRYNFRKTRKIMITTTCTSTNIFRPAMNKHQIVAT